MDGWRRSTGQPGTGVVIPDGLDDAGDDGAQHPDHPRSRDGWQTPLDCEEKKTETSPAPGNSLGIKQTET